MSVQLVPSAPTLTVSLETFDSVVADIAPLLDRHWEELAMFKEDIPLNVNWAGYKRGYDAGLIRAYGARVDGSLIGYAIFQVVPRHAHYAHRWAINDVIWVAPEWRNAYVGSTLCDFFEVDLRKDGPIVIVVETKAHSPALAALLGLRSYILMGSVYAKRMK